MSTIKTYDFLSTKAYVITRVAYFVRHPFPKTYDVQNSEVYVYTRVACTAKGNVKVMELIRKQNAHVENSDFDF